MTTQLKEVIQLDEILPVQYDLKIDVQSLANDSDEPELVKGELDYHFDVLKATNRLVLNCHEIVLDKVTLVKPLLSNSTPEISHNEQIMQTTLTFSEPLPIGTDAILRIEFHHNYAKDLLGHYDSTGHHLDGTPFRLSLTQFEPFYARNSFPCIDQPDAKALFNISILHPKDKIALSNMPVQSSTNVGDKSTLTVFQTTPKVSTYLVAWAIGDFESISGSCYDGKFAVNVYTMPGQKENASFALKTAVNAIEYLTKYTGIPIPLPKMDLLCVPDFSAGAMENWGLVTFREVALLADEKKSSIRAMKQIARTVTHELVHQWAGNLVTMTWWDELWLNEGFATFLADLVNNDLYPKWKIWNDFQVESQGAAFDADSKDSTHPIHVPILRVQDTEDIFDSISYEKSSCVLLMLNDFIGPEAFQKGFGLYLKELAYRNSTAEDLWEGFTKGTEDKIDVVSLMESWTKQTGHPLVIVRREGGKLHLSQKRFCRANLTNSGIEALSDETIWRIPLRVGVKYQGKADVTVLSHLMTERSITLDIADSEKIEWVKVNYGQCGFYRVLYADDISLNQLSAALTHNPDSLPVSDRLGIQSDLFSIANNSQGKIATCVECLSLVDKAYRKEDSLSVLRDAWMNLGSVIGINFEAVAHAKDNEYASTLVASFRKWKLGIFEPLAETLGIARLPEDKDALAALFSVPVTDDQEQVQLRAFVMNHLIGTRHKPSVEYLQKLFDETILPKITPIHLKEYEEMVKEVDRIERGDPEVVVSPEQIPGRIEADNALSTALQTIPANLRIPMFAAASLIQDKDAPLSELEVKRRQAFFAISHCISPILLPADQTMALSTFLGPCHRVEAKRMFLLCLSNRDTIGVRKMELYRAAAALCGLSQIGFGTEIWKLTIENEGKMWDALRARLSGNLISFMLEYLACCAVNSGSDERKAELTSLTEDFLTKRAASLPPITQLKIKEGIHTNTQLWDTQGAAVCDWIMNKGKS
ncbi:putative Puromycin-sensitive aminopeptidase [Blattamonas nauphoetae]|uniref:Aminopeptidase n=1 Tax=Blattamonas nauphoetae TaxID=2049346 RepID=A0ABQ9Y9T2_9EUKA|nr:putative Puromycin-sensitive aminopeptidase [Blattamonas nauphoetae]